MKCTTCGKQGDCNGTIEKCANCWEIEHRLAEYLSNEKGVHFVLNTWLKILEKGGIYGGARESGAKTPDNQRSS